MIIKKRFEKLPGSILELQKTNPLTSDLYLCEISELLISKNTEWLQNERIPNHMLIYCTNGNCIITIAKDKVHLEQDQFCIITEGFRFEVQIGQVNQTILYNCQFKNLSKGCSNANMLNVNFTFSHLLATFIFASRNSDDIMIEEDPLIQKTKRYLEFNVDKKLTLKEIAEEVGISPTYLSTIFKKKTNYSPISYFSHLKILKACEYLDKTKHKIKQIAFMLGYSDPYYFSKDFQKRMGISPKNYRKRLLN